MKPESISFDTKKEDMKLTKVINMKKLGLLIYFFQLFVQGLQSQNPEDSLVIFSDLKYHSDFEKFSVYQFVKQRKDTFNLFLAIDEKMTPNEAEMLRNLYHSELNQLMEKSSVTENTSKRIKIGYVGIHDKFLKKYNDNQYFPEIFRSGIYNCVSASMIYAITFDKLLIPYKVMASDDHVYLIANPGKKSVVIETTNPSLEKAIFTGEFKQQYVNTLRLSKLISDDDLKNKSVEEIFEENYNGVRDAELSNMPGFQYFNMALTKLEMDDLKKGYEFCQKAYFFYPNEKVKQLLYNSLLFLLERTKFSEIPDIDYLAQFSRFQNVNLDIITTIFENILNYHLQYSDKEEFCDKQFKRLVSQINNQTIIDELTFAYYLQMSYHFQRNDRVEYYVNNALKIRENHIAANEIMENYLTRKLISISNPKVLLDTVAALEQRVKPKSSLALLNEYTLIAYLRLARNEFMDNNFQSGENYLNSFESNCTEKITFSVLKLEVENTYYSIATKYFYKNNKTIAKKYVDRGLKFVPDSEIINSAINRQ